MNSFSFNPSDGFLNTNSYPDPASGTAARMQLQSLHSQTQNFINDEVVPAIDAAQSSITDLVSRMNTAETNVETLQSSLSSLSTALTSLSDAVEGFATQFTTAGLRLVVGTKTYAISVSNGTVTATEV